MLYRVLTSASLSTIVATQSQIDSTSAKRNKAKEYKCLVSGCKVRAWYGNVAKLPNYCEGHKQSGSVNLMNPTTRPRGKGKPNACTVQTKLVSFLTPESVKGSQTSSESQHVNTNAPDSCPRESPVANQLQI